MNYLNGQSVEIEQLLIADDGSSDNSFGIACQFIEEHGLQGKWTAIKNEKNLGPAGNFIQMCQKAEGEYVFFCDQDDSWMPDKIEKMCGIMDRDHHINLLYAPVVDTEVPEDRVINPRAAYSGRVKQIGFSAENYFFKGCGCAVCIRHSFMDQVIRYWTEGWEHDMFFWACALMTDSGYRYDRPVIWRRLHSGNVSMHEVKTLEKRKKQVRLSLNRPGCMRKLLDDFEIHDADRRNFLDQYERD